MPWSLAVLLKNPSLPPRSHTVVGVFRGLINGRLVVIRRYGADFTVEIDGATLENVKSLDEGLKKSMKAIECVAHTRDIEAFH